MASHDRPLSPHVMHYRPQLTSVLSVLHRGTGIVLSLGAVALALWLAAAAAGPASFARLQVLYGSPVGLLALLGFTFAFFYHLCNGIRHLFWDAGYGFELPTVYASGWAVVIASGVLTAFAWVVALTGAAS